MATQLSVVAEAFLEQNNITGNIILELAGFPSLYGSVKVTRVAKYGDTIFFGDEGLVYGGTVPDNTSKDYISLTGTTNNITQKLDQDRGGSSSITSFKIRLVDKDDELTQAFAPGVTVDDILGNEATVYWQPVGGAHPADSARLFVGIVSTASFGAGYVDIVVQHPSTLARQEILPKVTTQLTLAMSDVATIAFVEDASALVVNGDAITVYIRIGDELMLVREVVNGTDILIDARAQLGTVATSHDVDDEVESFYVISGGPIDLALRMLLSSTNNNEFATRTASRIVQVDAVTNISGAVFFEGINIQDELGLVVGDQMALTTGASVGNLFSYRNILSFGSNSSGSWVVVDQTLTPEIELSATCLFKSKYNTLTFGAGDTIKPYHVDVAQFERLEETFSANFFDYEWYVKDTLNLKDFLEDLYYPSGLFSLPRQGRISVGIAAPPILGPDAKTLNAENITNATRVAIRRSINEAFYNSITYKFNEDSIDDRFLSGVITTSEDSFNRVKVGSRTLTIEAGGIRESTANRNKITAISRRFLDRFQFGAEQVECDVNFKTAFAVEPGDTVILDGGSIKLSDITQGSRNFLTRVVEVVNRSINLKTGACRLTLSDTNLSTRTRYSVFSPSSIIGTGSTVNEIFITRSFSTEETELERDKWRDYVLQKVRVHNSDYSFDETTTLIQLDPSNPNRVLVNPALSSPPTAGMIMTVPEYDDSSAQAGQLYKALHASFNPQVAATGGSTTTVTVAPGDVSKFYVGAPVRIHLADYSEDDSTTVAEISGTTLTLNKTLAFTVTSSHLIDNIGFAGDKGSYYAWY